MVEMMENEAHHHHDHHYDQMHATMMRTNCQGSRRTDSKVWRSQAELVESTLI